MSESKHRGWFDWMVGIISILGFCVSVAGLIVTVKLKPEIKHIREVVDTVKIVQKDIRIIRDTVVLHDNDTTSYKGQKDEAKTYYENLEKQKENYHNLQTKSREAYYRLLDEQKEAYYKSLGEEKARYEKERGR